MVPAAEELDAAAMAWEQAAAMDLAQDQAIERVTYPLLNRIYCSGLPYIWNTRVNPPANSSSF